MLLSGLELIFGPFDGSIFILFFFACVVSVCCLCFSISHRSWNHILIQRNKKKQKTNVQPLECMLASVHLRYNPRLDTSEEISERRVHVSTSAEERACQGRAPTPGHFARTSKLLRSAVQRRRLKIKIARWPRRAAASEPPGLAEIHPSADVEGPQVAAAPRSCRNSRWKMIYRRVERGAASLIQQISVSAGCDGGPLC